MRAVAAYLMGWMEVAICPDPDEWARAAYAKDRKCCVEAGIFTLAELAERIADYAV